MPQSSPTSSPTAQKQAPKVPKPLNKQLRLPAFMPFFWLGIAALVGPILAHTLKLKQNIWLVGIGISLILFIIDLILKIRKKQSKKLSLFLILATICLSAFLYTRTLPKTRQNISLTTTIKER